MWDVWTGIEPPLNAVIPQEDLPSIAGCDDWQNVLPAVIHMIYEVAARRSPEPAIPGINPHAALCRKKPCVPFMRIIQPISDPALDKSHSLLVNDTRGHGRHLSFVTATV